MGSGADSEGVMENILANMEVRKVLYHDCWAIMHRSNGSVIYSGNQGMTEEQAEFVLGSWKELPFKYDKISTIAHKQKAEIDKLKDKIRRRNLQIKELKKNQGQDNPKERQEVIDALTGKCKMLTCEKCGFGYFKRGADSFKYFVCGIQLALDYLSGWQNDGKHPDRKSIAV